MFLSKNFKGTHKLGDLGVYGKIILKCIQTNIVEGCGLDSSGKG
jgi:hypothetical protein